MSSLDVLKILGLGVIGLGFLLAYLAYRLLGKIQLRPNPNPSVLRSIYFFMGFSIVLCGIGFVSQVFDQRKKLDELQAKYDVFVKSRERLFKVSGKIDVPLPGHPVPKTFVCEGTVAGFKEGEGVHIWLAVEIDGLIWPREAPLPIVKDGKWSTSVYEDGSGSTFSLILIAADEVAHAKIEEWQARGKSEKRFGSMNTTDGMIRLYRIDDLRREDKR